MYSSGEDRAVSPDAARLYYGHAPGEAVFRRRLVVAGLALVAVFLIGTAGYAYIGRGEWSLEDCAYMVLITITTVGYGEVLPVSATGEGRLFTMGLLVGGMGVSFYFLSALTAFIIEGDLREALWRRKMTKRLESLSGHYIVCGGGRTGAHVAEELIAAGHVTVIVDGDPDALLRLAKRFGDAIIVFQGDATEDAVLEEVGVERARGVVAALSRDQDNLFVALSARQLNAKLRIVSRGVEERAAGKLRQAGADVVVSPTHIGGRRMAHELLRPNVVGFLDLVAHNLERSFDIEEVLISDTSPLCGKKLAESRIREVSSALVLAVISGGEHHYNPAPDFTIEGGMILLAFGEREQLERLQKHAVGTA
jgi:voltage-gated potassium channel